MYGKIQEYLQNELKTIEANGLFKKERIITSAQGAEITVNGETVLNFCANNYLGLPFVKTPLLRGCPIAPRLPVQGHG